MGRAIKHTKTLMKRCLVPFLALTVMILMLSPPSIASHSAKALSEIDDLLQDPGKPIQNEVYKLVETKDEKGLEGILISPVKDKPGDSGEDDNDFWFKRLFD